MGVLFVGAERVLEEGEGVRSRSFTPACVHLMPRDFGAIDKTGPNPEMYGLVGP